MPSVSIGSARLKGPAGNTTTVKRAFISQAFLHGPSNKLVFISQAKLVPPSTDKHVAISQVKLVGPNSPEPSVYIGTASGWVPIELAFGGVTLWEQIPT